MSAENVGKLVKIEHSEYGHIEDAELGEIVLDKIIKDPAYLDHLLEVQSRYDPDVGRIRSWWRRDKSESRVLLIQQLAAEGEAILTLVRQRFSLEDLLDQQEQNRVMRQAVTETYQTQITENKYRQAELMTNAALLKLAAEHQMDLPTFLEYKKKIAFAQADIDAEAQMALNDIRFAQIAKFMTAHTQIDTLQKTLDTLYTEVYAIASGDEPDEVKRRKIESRERTISATEKDKAAIEKGLLQTRNGRNPRANRKKANDPEDPR